jgi:DNA-directed RNA polymerase subunit RPC12/RpoP
MPTFRAPAQLSRATPVICPECGGRAPLIRMSPDAFTRGKTEIWTYECAACGHKVEKTVETGATPSGAKRFSSALARDFAAIAWPRASLYP